MTKKNLLDRLKNKLDKQQRLFNASPKVDAFNKRAIENTFTDEGYLILNNIQDEFEAIKRSYEILNSLRETQLFYREFLEKVQLSKGDLIPVCEPFVEGGFQALHFDYGLPLMPSNEPQNETFDMFAVLYYPYTFKPLSAAITRIVNLQNLHLKGHYEEIEIERRINNYIEQHGDGWVFPEHYNTKRVSIFARILDAAMDSKQFSSRIDAHSQNFFMPKANIQPWQLPDKQLEMEYQYYQSVGIELDKIEKRLVLKPGQLLFIDNMRTIHGRMGFRQPKEIWQFLFGLEKSCPELIKRTKKFIIKSITHKQ
jgi:hypothetical protein